MYWEGNTHEADYWQGVLVITDKVTGKCGSVVLRNDRKHNVTLKQWQSSIKTHGVDRSLVTWTKLVNNWEG